MKHIICYSGGHSSAICAIEVCRRYGKENVILLNHNINSNVEDEDIKRFKKEIADYLGLEITFANYNEILDEEKMPNQFEISIKKKGFKGKNNTEFCTYELKTKPFYKYLQNKFSDKKCVVYYGFDDDEFKRVERRKTILNDIQIMSDFPLALWTSKNFNKFKMYLTKKGRNAEAIMRIENFIDTSDFERTILSTKEIGIEPPNVYNVWKHANCIGCLKAGKQHWYCVYVNRNDVFEEAKKAEKIIGYSIIKGVFLEDLEKDFEKMKKNGVPATEKIPSNLFWKTAKRYTKKNSEDLFPCECWS